MQEKGSFCLIVQGSFSDFSSKRYQEERASFFKLLTALYELEQKGFSLPIAWSLDNVESLLEDTSRGSEETILPFLARLKNGDSLWRSLRVSLPFHYLRKEEITYLLEPGKKASSLVSLEPYLLIQELPSPLTLNLIKEAGIKGIFLVEKNFSMSLDKDGFLHSSAIDINDKKSFNQLKKKVKKPSSVAVYPLVLSLDSLSLWMNKKGLFKHSFYHLLKDISKVSSSSKKLMNNAEKINGSKLVPVPSTEKNPSLNLYALIRKSREEYSWAVRAPKHNQKLLDKSLYERLWALATLDEKEATRLAEASFMDAFASFSLGSYKSNLFYSSNLYSHHNGPCSIKLATEEKYCLIKDMNPLSFEEEAGASPIEMARPSIKSSQATVTYQDGQVSLLVGSIKMRLTSQVILKHKEYEMHIDSAKAFSEGDKETLLIEAHVPLAKGNITYKFQGVLLNSLPLRVEAWVTYPKEGFTKIKPLVLGLPFVKEPLEVINQNYLGESEIASSSKKPPFISQGAGPSFVRLKVGNKALGMAINPSYDALPSFCELALEGKRSKLLTISFLPIEGSKVSFFKNFYEKKVPLSYGQTHFEIMVKALKDPFNEDELAPLWLFSYPPKILNPKMKDEK